MGAATVALAAIGKSIMPAYDTRFVMQTAPTYIKDWDQILDSIKHSPVSMVLYMALEYSARLFISLKKIYADDMPCAVVFWAGFPEKELIIKGTVSTMEEQLLNVEEKYMGILFVGRFLEGKPYKAVIEKQ